MKRKGFRDTYIRMADLNVIPTACMGTCILERGLRIKQRHYKTSVRGCSFGQGNTIMLVSWLYHMNFGRQVRILRSTT